VTASVFFAYRDASERRAALRQSPHSLERYRLFGLDEIAARGANVRHNLERPGAPSWARGADVAANRLVYGLGGYGGDVASLLASLRTINASDVVFSTVDTVGIPLVLMKRAGLMRAPLVYTAVGLPERLVQLRGRRMRALYADAFRRVRTIVAYAKSEVAWLRAWLEPRAPRMEFVPLGVDVDAFRPIDVPPEVDVLSIGADPRRDFGLLVTIATRRPELTFRIVASAEHARSLSDVPPNVVVETHLPLVDVRERLARARVVALPVRDNSYSGATTVLLQSMAMGKPVVVSRTEAIVDGYGLEDGINCRFVAPGDAQELERVLLDTLAGADAARSLGVRARETVERNLSWERYTNALWELLVR
jgi:glycosyltransferase involved in cell wall biosynthesis